MSIEDNIIKNVESWRPMISDMQRGMTFEEVVQHYPKQAAEAMQSTAQENKRLRADIAQLNELVISLRVENDNLRKFKRLFRK